MPTRFPFASSRQIIRAPLYVLPEPGGPWIGSTVRSSSACLSAASRSLSSARRAVHRQHPRRPTDQQVADRAVGSHRHRCRGPRPRSQGPRVQRAGRLSCRCRAGRSPRMGERVVGRPAPQVDGLCGVVDRHELGSLPLGVLRARVTRLECRVVDLATAQVVVLRRGSDSARSACLSPAGPSGFTGSSRPAAKIRRRAAPA